MTDCTNREGHDSLYDLMEQAKSPSLAAKQAYINALETEYANAEGEVDALKRENERLRGLPSLIPHTWLDPLLTGDGKVDVSDCNERQIEALLQAVKHRMVDALLEGSER